MVNIAEKSDSQKQLVFVANLKALSVDLNYDLGRDS